MMKMPTYGPVENSNCMFLRTGVFMSSMLSLELVGCGFISILCHTSFLLFFYYFMVFLV